MQKMKLIQINTVCNASTGRIMGDIQREAIRQGYNTISFVGRRKPFEDIPCEKFGNSISFWIHVAITTAFDRQGFGSYFATRKLIKRLREERPDIIHLHNLHGYYLYLPLLFRYLKEEFSGQLFWTFHDCWPVTGHCPHFVIAQCDKWKKECYNCPNRTEYPVSWLFDSSKKNYLDKKKMFSDLNNLTIIVPSYWMKRQVQQSFMKEYCVEIVPNGINLNVFKRYIDKGIRERYGISPEKKILLGVASVWNKGKGLADFVQISKKISDEYVIVLIGLDKNKIRRLPENMIGILRTENQMELAALYSEAHIFINPSKEESFSLVTVEAMACGTPSIVLDTSAVKELITEKNGIVLHGHCAEDYIEAIKKLEDVDLDRNQIVKCAQKYSEEIMRKKIVDMYKG